jgi:hypothetical protein
MGTRSRTAGRLRGEGIGVEKLLGTYPAEYSPSRSAEPLTS